MVDFVLNVLTGDLDFGGHNNSLGLQLHKDFGLEAAQRLNQAMQINLGEWFVNVLAGLPILRNPNESLPENLRYFLGDKASDSPRFVYNSFNSYITSLPFVTSLVSSDFTFDNKTRVFSYSFQAEIEDKGVITFPPIVYDFT